MIYTMCIEKVEDGFVASFPDIDGCYTAGETMEELFVKAKEAVSFHIEGMLEDGEDIPKPQAIEVHKQNPEYRDFILSVMDIDLTHLMGKSEKINVTLPSLLIRKIDEYVAHNPDFKNRSNFLAKISSDRLARL